VVVLGIAFFVMRPGGAIVSRKQLACGLLALGLFGSVAAYWVSREPGTRAKFERKQTELMALATGQSTTGSAAKRLEYYQVGWHLFKQKPLQGWGIGSWNVLYSGEEQTRTSYPHNVVLETAIEQGTLGLLSLFSFLLVLGFACRPTMRYRQKFAFITPVLAFCFLFSMFSGDIGNRTVWAFCGIALVIARMVRLEKENSSIHSSTWLVRDFQQSGVATSALHFVPRWEEPR
jgi:O-antigen ligase